MKKSVLSVAALLAFSMMIMGTAVAQDGDKEKEKAKSKSKLGDYEEIIIKKKSDGDSKVTVEIKDGEIKVDGKPIDDYESESLSVRRRKPAVIGYGRAASPFRSGGVTINGDTDFWTGVDSNRAFLGISSQESRDGVKIMQVTEESAAEKAGLKTGDIIVKIDDKKIEDPEDVTTTIRKHKPKDKITITYKRDDKEAKAVATLGMAKNSFAQTFNLNNDFYPQLDRLRSMENFRFDAPAAPSLAFNNRQRIGIRAQDTEESNGAKVLDIGGESAAEKAGIKQGDIITSFDGKNITNADDLSAAAREAKDKSTIDVKFKRAGKDQSAQIKIQKKLKTTSL
ncbi:MAG: PDZ domain-containing protein [Chitinophagaceae bacterium]|nr:MAG: PDZ domain-containing protein [Chitinophagaceae bacterium]